MTINQSNKNRSKISIVLKSKTTQRTFVAVTILSFITFLAGLVYFINPNIQEAYGSVIGNYRSVASGDWDNLSTWQTYDGSAWVAAASTPNSSNGSITIQNGHTVTVTQNVTVDELVVDLGATLIVSSGKDLVINQTGPGTDLTVNGTVTLYGKLKNESTTSNVINGTINVKDGGENSYAGGSTVTINNGGVYNREDKDCTDNAEIWTINSGGTYIHNFNGDDIPLAVWNPGSICSITGLTNSIPSNLDQSFSNFYWNSPNQTSVMNLQGKLSSIGGNFRFVSSGTGAVRLGNGENYTMNIGGNFTMEGGTLYGTSKSMLCIINIAGNYVQTNGTFAVTDENQDDGKGNPTINVSGDFTLSAGTFDMSQHKKNTTGEGITTLNLFGNLTISGGTFTETSSGKGVGEVFFKKSEIQYFSKSAGTMSNDINYTIVNNSIVDAGTSEFTSAGTFTIQSGGGFRMGSPDGITQSSSQGNVQVNGTRSYHTNADYTYNGISPQVTGNGLPATVRNLTINNQADLTLTNSVSVSNTMNFTLGKIITGSKELNITNSNTSSIIGHSASSYVIGMLRRSVSNSGTYDFPVGSNSALQLMSVTLSSISGFSNLLSTFVPGDPDPLKKVVPVMRDGKYYDKLLDHGYWTLDPNSSLTSGSYGVALNAVGYSNKPEYASTDPSNFTVLKRSTSSSSWDAAGVKDQAKERVLNQKIVSASAGLTTFSHFGQGSGGSTLPIKLISFDARLNGNTVDLTWSTGSEVNNEYFTIERSKDGAQFHELFRVHGAGNSTSTRYYSGNDDSPSEGYNYYRLKQTDYDGRFSYSNVRTIKMKNKKSNATPIQIESVYPNPFIDAFSISFQAEKAGEVTILLLNSSGQIVEQEKVSSSVGRNIHSITEGEKLSKGIYYVALVFDNQRELRKVIKN